MLILLYSIAAFVLYLPESELSHSDFEVKRFELCNSTQGIAKFYGNITKDKDNNQYISYNVSLPYDFDENVGVVCDIYSKPIGTHFVELFSIREKNFCNAANIYLGEFWYDLEWAAQMTPRMCPIRAGKYNVHRSLLNFRKITLQTFPFGRLRFIIKPVDNRNANINLLCILIEVENNFN